MWLGMELRMRMEEGKQRSRERTMRKYVLGQSADGLDAFHWQKQHCTDEATCLPMVFYPHPYFWEAQNGYHSYCALQYRSVRKPGIIILCKRDESEKLNH